MIVVEGAWLDVLKRKLAVLPDALVELFAHMPRSADYVELEG